MVEISNVNFQYENAEQGALHDVSLQIKPGECVLLCGESGCGKTTITRLINGLIPHFYEGNLSGEVKVAGLSVKEEELYTIAGKVGSVFQNPRSQFFCLDTTSELAFGCENMGLPVEEIEKRMAGVTEALKLQKLLARNIFELSGGEKQRIACASVSAMLPDVFVLDEPTSNLDMDAIEELKHTLQLWKAQGKTIVIAEHRLYWLKEVCDRVICLKEGRIVFDIPMKEFAAFSEEKMHEFGLRGMTMQRLKLPEKVGETPGSMPSGQAENSDTERTSEAEQFFGAERTFQTKKQGNDFLKLLNYRLSFDKKEVLHMADEEIPTGSIIAVTGHNGAGKSTFLRCLCGLEKKFKGRTLYRGKELDRKKMLKECYMVMQDVNHQLFCETVSDEIRLGMVEEREEDVQKVLEKLDLSQVAERHPMSLSGGQKQRVAIASSILADKSILIFDEPTSGLDYKHMEQTAALFRELRDENRTLFIITHDPELIVRCCTHILHLEQGEVEELYSLDKTHEQNFLRQFSY